MKELKSATELHASDTKKSKILIDVFSGFF